MSQKSKYYVVWEGVKPGIYTTWDEAKAQVDGYPSPKYKSFTSIEEATFAFRKPATDSLNKSTTKPQASAPKTGLHRIIEKSICVDAGCQGNPGLMDYRGVDYQTRKEIFHVGPMPDGTNNIGEYLAIVHALALLHHQKDTTTAIYSDSVIAMLWIKAKKHKSKLALTSKNQKIFELLERADTWLQKNTYQNKILKWETEVWGEIPADFGRK